MVEKLRITCMIYEERSYAKTTDIVSVLICQLCQQLLQEMSSDTLDTTVTKSVVFVFFVYTLLLLLLNGIFFVAVFSCRGFLLVLLLLSLPSFLEIFICSFQLWSRFMYTRWDDLVVVCSAYSLLLFGDVQ